MRVDSDACVAKQVGKPLRHQDPDLFDGAAQLEDAHVQTGLGPLCAVPVERNLFLDKREEGQHFIIHFFWLNIWALQRTWRSLCAEAGTDYLLSNSLLGKLIEIRRQRRVSGRDSYITRPSLQTQWMCLYNWMDCCILSIIQAAKTRCAGLSYTQHYERRNTARAQASLLKPTAALRLCFQSNAVRCSLRNDLGTYFIFSSPASP